VAGLAGQVDRLRAEVNQIIDEQSGLRADLAAHGRALTRLTNTDPTASPGLVVPGEVVPDWLTVTDPHLAITWLTNLSVWMQEVWNHYPSASLPGCWRWHPSVVTELLTCQHTWIEATKPGTGSGAFAAWHDRWRPTTAERVHKTMTGCLRAEGCHTNPTGHHYHYNTEVLDEYAHWWVTHHSHQPEHLVPGLTRENGPHTYTSGSRIETPRTHTGVRL
jgi:hypothetical protein